jgi:hypothetical protein
VTAPAHAANAARNAEAMAWRYPRWRPARAALWRLLERHVRPDHAVAVVGAGNGHDLPLRRLRRRAGRLDLIDRDPETLRRACRRGRGRPVVADITRGRADAIACGVLGQPAPPAEAPLPPQTYDVVVGDLLYTQLLYPALADGSVDEARIDQVLTRDGAPLTEAVVRRMHEAAPLVVHVHDVLGWWPEHPQPFSLEHVLELARDDVDQALALVATGNLPLGCDPRAAVARLGAAIVETAFWHWPFARGTDYLVCATVART